MMRIVLGVVAVALLAGRPAHAQPADVPALIKLIENQPADMPDRSAWKEKRREAARSLAKSKDKRAVPELIKLADGETFDIIGEIAIEGLGTLGDPSAVPTLQKIAADNARDPHQRDLAKKSLAKLGSSAEPEKPPVGSTGGGNPLETKNPKDTGEGGGSGSGSGSAATGSSGSKILEGGTGLTSPKSSEEMPALPDLADDTLAAYDRLTFAGGTASFAYDTGRKRVDFNADVAGLWQKRIERESMAWGVDAGAHVLTGYINPTGRGQSRGAQIDANADGEARIYSGPVYGVGKLAASLQTDYVTDIDPMNAMNDYRLTTTQADVGVEIGGGYGRVLDIGAAIRVRRLSRTLDAARALGKPIDAATSRKLQLTWWALRGERSTYRALVATVAILREAGILLGEPDSGLSYEILNVLRDTQLFVRPSGLDIQVAFGESYLRRPQGIIDQGYENGRVENLFVSAGYGQQLDDDKLELAGTAYARYRVLAADMAPVPWALGASAHATKYTYGDHGDPFGMFDLTGRVQLSTDDRMGTDKAFELAGELGFTMLFNQASGLRLAGQFAFDQGTFLLGANLQATYGLLDGTFAK
jgi:hypothetical protein